MSRPKLTMAKDDVMKAICWYFQKNYKNLEVVGLYALENVHDVTATIQLGQEYTGAGKYNVIINFNGKYQENLNESLMTRCNVKVEADVEGSPIIVIDEKLNVTKHFGL